jgi:branched-chain amino acid aminotransferase
LYVADEVFMTGTAAHVTPVLEIDHRPVATGDVGPITLLLRDRYADVIVGRNEKYAAWCRPVYGRTAASQHDLAVGLA